MVMDENDADSKRRTKWGRNMGNACDAKHEDMHGEQTRVLRPHNPSPSFTFADLFCGLGGFRIACEAVGGKCVYSSDVNRNVCRTYELNFGENSLNDITKTDTSDIPSMDVICGGMPCQSFSLSGKQRGFADTRGTLFFDILRIARHHHPKVVFIENVANLERHDNGRTFMVMLNALDECGYATSYKVLRSSDYGVPQARKRIYLIAVRKDLAASMPSPFAFPAPVDDSHTVCLEDVLSSDPSEYEPYVIERDYVWTKTPEEIAAIERQRKAVQIGHVRGRQRMQGYRVYSPKGAAITLSAYGGGAGAKTGLYLVGDKVRKLSPRECLKVQGFPEWYRFPDDLSDSARWQQTGNSVSVPVLEAIMREVVRQVPGLAG